MCLWYFLQALNIFTNIVMVVFLYGTSDVCAGSSIDCSAAVGCTNESGEANCFCNVGYELIEDGLTCRGKLPFIFKL